MDNINLIYCICLDERKSHMINFFNKINVKYNFIKPVLGSELKKYSKQQLIEKEYIKSNHTDLSYSDGSINYNKIANAISFINTLKIFLLTDQDFCLIFEDDIEIPTSKQLEVINLKFKKLFDTVDSNWQYINLGRCWDESCNVKYNSNHFELSYCLPVCTHAILIKRNIAFNLIHNTLPLSKPKDNVWKELIHKNNHWMKYSYCAVPAIFHQDRYNLGSNLGNNHKQRECSGTLYSIKRFFKYYNPKIIETFIEFNKKNKKNSKFYLIFILLISLIIYKFL